MKLNLVLIPFATLAILVGCASQNTKTTAQNNTKTKPSGWRSFGEESDYQPSSASSRIQQHLVEEDLANCSGCIQGSSHHGTFTSPLRVYELVGADHLNLKNTHFDLPVSWNKDVAKWVTYFTGKGRGYFERYSQRAGRYAPVLSKILADNGLPRDLIYLAMAESGFQNHAKSWAKAVGPWQFMPYTGKKYGLNIDWYMDERRDPLKASVAASGYLKDLYDLFGSWELATAGYNAGEGKMGRAIQRYGTRDFWKLTHGRYLRPETKNYVPKIMALAIIGKNLESFGFTGIQFEHPHDYEEVTVKGNSDLYELSTVLGLDFEELQSYNPELIRWQTPPYAETYVLKVPVGKKETWESVENKDAVLATKYQTYSTKSSSELSHVASKFKLPLDVLRQLNPALVGKSISPNTVINLPFREDHGARSQMYADLYEKTRRGVRSHRSY